MMNWIYTWYQPKRDLPFPQLIEQMLRIYFFGLVKAGSEAEPWFTARGVGERQGCVFALAEYSLDGKAKVKR